jgi:hypothetical protein
MYMIDKPLYAIQLADGSLGVDQWTTCFPVWVTFSKPYAEHHAELHEGSKVVLYSDYIKEKQDEINAQESSRSC